MEGLWQAIHTAWTRYLMDMAGDLSWTDNRINLSGLDHTTVHTPVALTDLSQGCKEEDGGGWTAGIHDACILRTA